MTAVLTTAACSGGGKASAATAAPADTVAALGAFSGDSALAYATAQTDMGPRTPGSEAHGRCAGWIAARAAEFGADTVVELRSSATRWDGEPIEVRNILARFNPAATARVILLAHYDTRPWADSETDPALREIPIDGANDGASGVAVLLEVARNLELKPATVGVDLLFVDAEDSGLRSDAPSRQDSEDTWCLGSQAFARDLPYTVATMPRYGILLDMVGGRDARFNREYLSATAAPLPTARVWGAARDLGLSDRFPMQIGGAVTDDHLPLIRAGIPVTDIIENQNPSTGAFPPYWHTAGDNASVLSSETLGDVGRVVLHVIYSEKP